ncbi:MAG: hypothetical protein AAGB93_21265 [Planctomycetota bacterium]
MQPRPILHVLSLVGLSAIASAQAERSVQIRSVDFDTQIIELFNYGSADVALDGWQFCSFDDNEGFVYTNPGGLNGVTIEAGTPVFVHFGNDAPAGDPDRIDRNVVGPFATPLDLTAWGLLIFDPPAGGSVNFDDSTQIADYVQWNVNGTPNGSASTRADQAVAEGLWTGVLDFVPTVPLTTTRIDLTVVADNRLHGPADYTVIGPTFFDEARGDEASGDHLNPTVLAFPLGSSTVVVNQQGDFEIGGRDVDYITFDVPAGQQLAALNLEGYIADPFNQAFFGLVFGSSFPNDADNTGLFELDGGLLVNDGQIGTDILPGFAQFGSSFSAPLDPGTYTIWFNQTGPFSEAILGFVFEPGTVGTPYCGPGATNSTGQSGRIDASGSTAVVDNDLTLRAFDLPQNALSLAIVSRTQGFAQMPGGSVGNLCLGGTIGRFVPQATSSGSAGEAFVTVDLNGIPQPNGLEVVLPGETWNFQFWHRDAVMGTAVSNFTDGLSVTFN